jgi:hypothetical protein
MSHIDRMLGIYNIPSIPRDNKISEVSKHPEKKNAVLFTYREKQYVAFPRKYATTGCIDIAVFLIKNGAREDWCYGGTYTPDGLLHTNNGEVAMFVEFGRKAIVSLGEI